MAADLDSALFITDPVSGEILGISAGGAQAYFGGASILATTGEVYALSEVTDYVTKTATGSAFNGSCEFAGWYCSVAVGNITVYDALSATGTAIVPTQALTVGPLPIFGPGTNGKLKLTTGCWVVLSGAATVRMLVTGA